MEPSQVQRTSLPKPKDLHLSLLSKKMSPKMSSTQIYSPVTDLAMGLGELSTSGYGNTPKRRLSLAADGTPTPTLKPIVLEKQLSADAGFEDGCGLDDSPFLASRFGDLLNAPLSGDNMSGSTKSMFQSSALRRFHSMPVPFCGFEDAATTPEVCSARSKLHLHTPFSPCSSPAARSPAKFCLKLADEDDETSQDSGVCVESEHLSQPEGKVLGTDFRFAEPLGRPPMRRVSRVLSDETNNLLFSPTKPSAFSSLFQSPAGSPVKLHHSSLTSGDDDDDGFLELVDVDDLTAASTDAPSSMSGLFTNPLMMTTGNSSSSSEDDGTPLRRRAYSTDAAADQENRLPVPMSTNFGSGSKRGLFRSPSCPRAFRKSVSFCPASRQGASKRSEPDSGVTPVQTKRRKSLADDQSPTTEGARTLQRCYSETEALIKSAMMRRDEEPNLIGDLSRSYTLPLCRSKHQDLKAISPETMAALLNGEFDDSIERAIIVDARYPYEFDGGHIRGALNLWTKDTIMEHFLAPGRVAELNASATGKRTIIIFHCEFSSERGPRLCRFLRNKDRDANRDTYPALDFPELYLLEGGYKAFFYGRQELCEPHTYKPMLHADHGEDLRHFRAKSKSWAGEKTGRKGRVPFRPGLKL